MNLGFFEWRKKRPTPAAVLLPMVPPPKPSIWVLRDHNMCWHKVVSAVKPKGQFDWCVIGPIDTELNAEELADRMTTAQLNPTKIVTYADLRAMRPKPAPGPQRAEAKPELRSVDDEWQ